MKMSADKFEEAIELEKVYCPECDHIQEDEECDDCGEECIPVSVAQGNGDIEVDDGEDDEIGIISLSDDED